MTSVDAQILELSNIYNTVLLTELSARLGVPQRDVEDRIVALIWANKLKAKIDQVEGLVFFEGHHEIDEWEGKIERLLATLNEASEAVLRAHPELA